MISIEPNFSDEDFFVFTEAFVIFLILGGMDGDSNFVVLHSSCWPLSSSDVPTGEGFVTDKDFLYVVFVLFFCDSSLVAVE